MALSKIVNVHGRIKLGANYIDVSASEYQEGLPEEIFRHDTDWLMSRGMVPGTSSRMKLSGKDVHKKYEDFIIELCGVAVRGHVEGPEWLVLIMQGGARGEWDVQVFRIHIYHRSIKAYIRLRWTSLLGWIITIEDIHKISWQSQSEDTVRLCKGLEIVSIVRKTGRPSGRTFEKEVFQQKYRRAYNDLIEAEVNSKRPSQDATAAKMNMTLKTFSRHLEDYGLPWPPDNTLDFDLE